jgi:hypothetical protein
LTLLTTLRNSERNFGRAHLEASQTPKVRG